MKKILYTVLCTSIVFAATNIAIAQKNKSGNTKSEEIVIWKKGDNNTKFTIEMNNDDILINGKPLADFNDSNITVMERNRMMKDDNEMFMRPREFNNFSFNDNDAEETSALLGVTTEKSDDGVKITEVAKGSAAEKSGLKEGDIISKINSTTVNNPEELMDAIKSYKPKTEVKIYYQRAGKAGDTKAVLGERKQSISGNFSFNNNRFHSIDKNMFDDLRLKRPSMPAQFFRNFWMPPNKRLGLKIEDTDDDNGAKIINVTEGSNAAKAGLKKDDVIIEVDGKKIKNTDDVKEQVMQNEKPGFNVKAKRGTSEMNFEIRIPKDKNTADL